MITEQDIEKRFTYVNDPNKLSHYACIRSAAKAFALDILTTVPQGREQLLAITKLEEVVMWANAGIARNP